MECDLASFPCRYLGLPLSLRRLTATDLQPILDRIVDALSGWKVALMATSGKLMVVTAVLTAIPIYLLIALDVPKWFIKANLDERFFGREERTYAVDIAL